MATVQKGSDVLSETIQGNGGELRIADLDRPTDGWFTLRVGDFNISPRVEVDVKFYNGPADTMILISARGVPCLLEIDFDQNGLRINPGAKTPVVRRTSVHTGGGCFVGGSVHTGGGDFVGGDCGRVVGRGAYAAGPGARAVGAGGVLVNGDHTGSINTGRQVYGVDTAEDEITEGTISVRIVLNGKVRVAQVGSVLQGIVGNYVSEMITV